MSADERHAFVDKQMAERKTLNERMAALVKKRDLYVREQAAKAPKPAADSSTARWRKRSKRRSGAKLALGLPLRRVCRNLPPA